MVKKRRRTITKFSTHIIGRTEIDKASKNLTAWAAEAPAELENQLNNLMKKGRNRRLVGLTSSATQGLFLTIVAYEEDVDE